MQLQFITLSKAENLIFILSIFTALIPFAAIAPYISFHISFLFSLIILLSVVFHIKKLSVPIWLLNLLSIVLIIFPFFSYSIEDIILPSVESLTLILSIRFLGKKSSREYFQIYLLCMLLVGSSSLFSISWVFLLRIFLMLILTVFAIIFLTYIKDANQKFITLKTVLNILKFALSISLLSIPLSALFFLILPRTPSPLIDVGFSKTKTGFSSTVNLGSVRVIEEDRTIIMRVKMKKISEKELYWRVITFDSFDGKVWRKTVSKDSKTKISGEKIEYAVSLEPLTEDYLTLLDYPSNIYMKNISYEYPGIYFVNFPIEKTIKYTATSFINYQLEEAKPDPVYIEVTDSVSEKVKKLTYEITTNASNNIEVVEKIMKFLSNYSYSLKNLPTTVEDFLFNRKTGNCEYFATTMALMLRIKGVPSRVIGGFKGGDYNPFGNYYIVRASDAHLWVEAWINGEWIRFDPSGRASISASFVFHFIDYIWNRVVLDYDIKAQIKLTKYISSPDIKLETKILFIPLCLIFLFVFFKIFNFLRQQNNPLYKFFKIMKRYGFERKKYQGLEEFISSIKDSKIRQKAEKFAKAYEEIYFMDKTFKKEDVKKLNQLLKYLENIKS